MTHIGLFLEERRQNDAQAERLPPLPAGELRGRVEAALRELEDFRSKECASTVAELLSHVLSQDIESSLRAIQGQLRLYEDDNAEDLLNQLLCKLEKEEGANDEVG